MIDYLHKIEFGLSPLALLLLLLYHLYLFNKIKNRPLETAIGAADQIRALWVEDVVKRQRDILAVQTLRNWTMAATFLASTAILIALGVFNIILTVDKQGDLATLFNHFGNQAPIWWITKLTFVGINFFFAFFNFTLAIRYYNQAGFALTVPMQDNSPVLCPENAKSLLYRGARHYTMGMRAFYLSIPLALWLLGPIWFLLSTVVLLLVFRHIDKRAGA